MKAYTGEEDELGAVLFVLESRYQSIGVGVGKVETWACPLLRSVSAVAR